MRYLPRCASRAVFAVVLSLMVGACAYSIPEVDPADIPSIRQALSSDPLNTDLQVQLGMAQFKGEMYEAARTNLQAAVDSGNVSGPALLYLGMVQEEFEDWDQASDAYTRYLEVGRSEPLKAELRGRLQYLAQNVLQQRAANALATEDQLANAQPTPRSIAVFPFAFNSSRDDLEPLIYAISDMMVTDFAVSNALTVLERAQIQALLNEMALTEAGYAEPGTGARAGRMLQAEHVVQGVITTLGDDNIQIDADILNVPSSGSAGDLSESNSLENLFEIEKDLVFGTLAALNVQLTPAERQQIDDNRTENVLAFLAYGRGLLARDQGNYQAAQAAFQQAQQLDPNFDAAATQSTETSEITTAQGTSTADIAVTASTTGETGTGGGIAPPTSTTTGVTQTASSATLRGASEAVNPTPTAQTIDLGSTSQSDNQTQQQTNETRDDAVQESQGSEGATSAAQAQIRIVIRRPGGAQ